MSKVKMTEDGPHNLKELKYWIKQHIKDENKVVENLGINACSNDYHDGMINGLNIALDLVKVTLKHTKKTNKAIMADVDQVLNELIEEAFQCTSE